MNTCLSNSTQVGTSNYSVSLFSNALARRLSCGPSQYLRPDLGGALVPWIIAFGGIAVHAPVLWERVRHWKKVQLISLSLALFNVLVTIAAYWSSSHFDPRQILVWMPLVSTLDAGAMQQLVVLIVVKDGGWKAVWNTASTKIRRSLLGPVNCVRKRRESNYRQVNHNTTTDRKKGKKEKKERRALVAMAALVLLCAITSLQVVGLVFATKGLGQKDLTVSYCSAAIDNIVVAVYDDSALNTTTNCGTWYTPSISVNHGISCLSVPAKRQQDWLLATVIILPISLACQIIDFLILARAPKASPEQETKEENPEQRSGANSEQETRTNPQEEERDSRRPWLTMFTGIVILIALGISSFQHSMNLPDGVSKSAIIFRHDPTADSFGACYGQFHAAGLRGSILAYADGVLWLFGKFYVGQ